MSIASVNHRRSGGRRAEHAGPAGDVNGDGYDDVVVGAQQYDGDLTDEGKAYVYYGSASGLSADPAWEKEGDYESARFGASAITAGDVNGDGYDDVIVGAPFYNSALTGIERAFVYLRIGEHVTKYYYAGSQRVAMRQDGVVTYLHGDHLGSTSLVTNDTGGFVARVLYYPYGETRYEEGTLTTDYGFTGQRKDSYLDTYHMGAREYAPSLGRWLSADTIVPEPGNLQGFNRYSYVYNNPLKYIDPSGHSGYPPGCENSQQCMDWWDANHPGDEPPWYTPILVGMAKAWQQLDSKIGEVGRYLEADRIATGWRLQAGLKGNPFGEGPGFVAETPRWTIKMGLGATVRTDYGDPDGWRFDTAGVTTIRIPGVPDLVEVYASGDFSEVGVTFKGEPVIRDTGLVDMKSREKGGLGVTFAEPLNATLTGKLSEEYQPVLPGGALAVKIEPYVQGEITAHGGPTVLVAAPVVVFCGGTYLLDRITRLGTTAPQRRPGWTTP